jgi:oligopeptide transport system permease protein
MSDPDAALTGANRIEVTPADADLGATSFDAPRSLGQDAWDQLRRNPVVILSAAIIAVLIVMAVFPGWFTNRDPRDCNGALTRQHPSGDAWFGYTLQGCDVYSRTIFGARASIVVGFLAALGVFVLGVGLGTLAGFVGGAIDSVVSRIADIFFGIPFVLGAIIVLTSFPSGSQTSFWGPVSKVAFALAALGWPAMARLSRASTLQVRSADYVAAARALGATSPRIVRHHVLPNAVQPAIVYATIALGAFIGAEATLSYLGVGLQPPVVSWGIDIADGQDYFRTDPHMLFFPALFLSVTVLAFIMLGDAVRDALDPKLR